MKFVPASASRSLATAITKAKASSPKTFFVVGIAGVGVGTVLACRATLDLSEKLEGIKENADAVKVKARTVNAARDDEQQDPGRELTMVYLRGSGEILKLYAPSVAVLGLSVAALTGSHIILTRRNAALTAAYATLLKWGEDYRERVREEVGEDRELEIYRAIEWQEVEGSDGKMLEPVADPGKWGPHVRFFDEASSAWQNNAELNRVYIQTQQDWANDLLLARGHVFLNEVYDMLGLDRSPAGQLVGWYLDGSGDEHIDFGMYEAVNKDFIDRREKSVLLDFNVMSGTVHDKI